MIWFWMTDYNYISTINDDNIFATLDHDDYNHQDLWTLIFNRGLDLLFFIFFYMNDQPIIIEETKPLKI